MNDFKMLRAAYRKLLHSPNATEDDLRRRRKAIKEIGVEIEHRRVHGMKITLMKNREWISLTSQFSFMLFVFSCFL